MIVKEERLLLRPNVGLLGLYTLTLPKFWQVSEFKEDI